MISYITRYTNLSSKKFLLRPRPQMNELLSSWLVRVALSHHTLPWSFMNMHFPEYKNIVFSRDVDIWAPESFIDKLVWKSGLNPEDIFNMTLRSYEGYLSEKVRSNGQNNFISSIIPRKRLNLGYGQKYCPICLREDTSYFKKEWRLSFYTTCIEHGCHMMDRCQNCGAPVVFYKFKNDYGFERCYRCEKLLSRSQNNSVESIEELALVKRLMGILIDGYVVIDGQIIYSTAFFDTLHQVAKIVKHFKLNELDNFDGIIKAEKIVLNLRVGIKELLGSPKICFSHLTQDMPYVPFFYFSYLSK